MKREKTIERKVADTITQQPIELTIAGRSFAMPRPSIATLVLMSAAISEIPEMRFDYKQGEDVNIIVNDVLRNAKDCEKIGEILAIALLGAKGISGTKKVDVVRKKHGFLGILGFEDHYQEEVVVDKKAELAQWLMENTSPSELANALFKLVSAMEVGDFFALITSLKEVMITKATNQTTAFGR